jgi:hypothetical protein
MQIGGASSYFAPAAAPLPARPAPPAGPPETATDSSRAAQAQVSGAQPLAD